MKETSKPRDTVAIVYWALAANVTVAISKAIISVLTHSSSIFAEAVHSLADSVNQLLLLYGLKQSRKRPSRLHPFGYARESYFWSFMAAVFLFTLGGSLAVYRGVQKYLHPGEGLTEWGLAYLVLFLSALFEGISLFKATKMVQSKRRQMGFYEFLKHCKEPELLIVFLEDLSAEVGLSIAFLGVGLSHWTGLFFFDALATILIGILLCSMAIFLALEVRSLLVGERASQLDEYKIRRAIRQTNMVEQVMMLSTQHLGPDEIMVAIKCKFPDYLDSQEVAEAIDLIGMKIRKALPRAKQIFIEPELALPD